MKKKKSANTRKLKSAISSLLGCPWCGSKPEPIRIPDGVHLGCVNDKCRMNPSLVVWEDKELKFPESFVLAVKYWNNRA